MDKRLVCTQYILIAALPAVVLTQSCAFAQSAEVRLGDATVTPGLSSRAESYGINSPAESIGSTTFATRHYRNGNEGGIGSSYLGTTSATAESQPVSRYSSPAQVNSPAVSTSSELFRPLSFSETMIYSPALAPQPYRESVSIDLTGQSYASAGSEKIDSSSSSVLFGHRSSRGSFLPLMGTSNGTEPLSK
jgi:hypothetical protein